ncbi:hypothetical protein 8P_016 [Pseudomonas phage 8P]|nr:hypothetical protein 8P_016 [Pseudomonas phage 8P]
MPYVPPNGSAVELDLTGDYRAPGGASVNLEFDPSTAADVRQASVASSGARVGAPSVQQSTIAKARGADTSAFGRLRIERDTPKIAPAGIDSTMVAGTPEYVRWPRWIEPASMVAPIWPLGTLRIRLMGGYNPPPADSLVLNWFAEPYAPPPASSLQLDFGALGYGYVWPAMGDVSAFGTPTVAEPFGLRPAGIAAPALGVPRIQTSTNELRVSGFLATEWGSPNLQNKGVALKPGGIAPGAFGTSYIWNLLQFLGAKGFDGLKIGEAFVSGGIKIVTPNGLDAPAIGRPVVVNTTADQTARPTGIAAPAITGPHVSPRTIFPYGVAAAGFGTLTIRPNPSPKGFDTSLYGVPAIEFKTKYLTPAGIDASESGFPRVFDPTRKLFVSSVVQAGVFGDTRIANRSFVVRVPGSDYLEILAWTYVENTRRYLAAPGWNSAAFGALEIANKSPSIIPPGFDSLAIGTAAVGYSLRYIAPAGINSMRLGAPVLTKTPEIAPKGFAGAMGAPTVWRRVRTLEVLGHDSQQFGAVSVWFRYRYIPLQGFAADSYGKPKAEHGRRTLLASGMQHAAYGTASVTNADRTIAPKSIFENFATGHMVGGLRFLRPVGFDAARFGSRIIPEIQQVYPQGFTGLYGLPLIFNFRKVITPASITTGVQPADRWGTARAWNLRQYVVMSYDPDSALNPPAWPQWTKIENRTREIRISGHLSSRIGDQQADNKARPLYAEGIAAPATPASYEAGMVAFRVRPFRLEGIEPPYLSTWASVRNAAAVLKPVGSVATLWGVPAVENTRRNFERIGGFDSAWYGYPMVAERVRTLSFEGRYTIGAPVIPLPEVKLHTRYVDGIGYDASGIGWASLSIHWTLITPRWTLQNLYGIPAVRNVTPELRTRGRASDEFGDAFVRLEWRPVAPDGALTQLFGKTIIAFRDRTVSVAGLRAWAFGDKLTVVKTGAPPYSMQTINLDAEYFNDEVVKEGQGIPPPENGQREQVPRPIINQQVVYVRQEDPATRYGNHRVTANSIRVEPGIGEYLVGEPFVALKVRQLTVAKFPEDEVFEPEKPRLSPHTIYAVREAPQQAILNHPRPQLGLHYVDGYNRQPGAIFGRAEVTLQHRVINARYFASQWILPGYGRPTLQLKRHYITPNGFTTFRAGWHTVPGTQTVTQFDSAMMSLYGAAKVEHYVPPGPRTVKPTGLNAQAFGANRIDLFHREVKPQGHYATLMGTRKPGDSPYMWQGLRVGPLMPTIPSGAQTDLYGEPWVSFRVRDVAMQGFDAFLSEYDLEAFDKRMRVTRSEAVLPSHSIAPVGILATDFAASDVKPGIHFIRPDGNADQYRKGAF